MNSIPLQTDTFRGQRALVIGGTSGWGAAAASLLTAHGADVVVASRSGGSASMRGVRSMTVDARDDASLSALADELGDVHHVLVTAASIAAGPVHLTPFSAVTDTIVDWVKLSYETARVFGPRLPVGGSLTFSSGVAAIRPAIGLGAPAAAGAAIEALVRVLALELAPARVNAVRPAATDTGLFRRLAGGADDATVEAIGHGLPLGRIADPNDVAGAAVLLMASPYVTGTVLAVDGATSLA